MQEDLEKSVYESEAKGPTEDEMESRLKRKIQGKYRLLAPFCDEDGA